MLDIHLKKIASTSKLFTYVSFRKSGGMYANFI